MSREAFIRELRELATIIEDNPDLNLPGHGKIDVDFWSPWDLDGYMQDHKKMARTFKDAFGGRVEKEYDSYFIRLVAPFEQLKVQALFSRSDVCERTQVGTKIEEKNVLPEGVEYVVEKMEVPIYEWDCVGALLA